MRVKICGATRLDEVALLNGAGVDFVGLWHGVPGGRTELSLDQLTSLRRRRTQPVLVTLMSAVDDLVLVVRRSGIDWVQLHGYQQPGVIRALKSEVSEHDSGEGVAHQGRRVRRTRAHQGVPTSRG